MLTHDRRSQRLALGLAVLAGFVDSLGFLSLGGFFLSFMSGNSTRLGVGLGGGVSLAPALVPLGLIALFVFGVMLGRIVRHHRPGDPSVSVMVMMALLLLLAAFLATLGITTGAVSLMALAMGAANNVFVREGEVSIGVTYMTGTLVKLGQRLAGTWLGGPDRSWLPYLLLWLSLVLGALAGAICFAYFGLMSVWLAAGFCAALPLGFHSDSASSRITESPTHQKCQPAQTEASETSSIA